MTPETPTPETRFAKSDDLHIAYQVVGDDAHPLDLVLAPGWVSHVEHAWEEPHYAAFLRRLAGFSRLVLFDRRGTGLSDRVARLPTLEERMDDVRAVMDAAGSRRAALLGISEGGPMCTLFAATHPERTTALVLCNAFARNVRGDDHPWCLPTHLFQRLVDEIGDSWGQGRMAELLAPSLAGDREFVRRWARFERLAVSPGAAQMLLQMIADTDVREVLPLVRVPTLVVHRLEDQAARIEGARYLARRIAGARLVELPGGDHFPWVGDVDALVGEIEEFLTGARSAPEADRVLATVLFVDIADSTRRLAELGDRRWGALLERFLGLVRAEVRRFGGRLVDTAGDGGFATFDGPVRAIRCALALRDAVRTLDLALRAGVHTGECHFVGGRATGIAVHLGARVAAEAVPDEVLVSSTVKHRVAGADLRFEDRRARALRGIPGTWHLHAVAA